MRIGIFSDVHGNIYAFEKIWKMLKKESPDMIFFLGDICGYYYYQNEIIEILKDCKDLICIKGNHDDIFLNILDDEKLEKKYTEKFGKSLTLLKKKIKINNLDFLKALPEEYMINEEKIAIFHGSPRDHLNGYVYPTDSLQDFLTLGYKYILLGHTHRPMDRCVGDLRVLNPGSCGQPRDFNQPSFAILDSKSGKVEFRRAEYDRRPLIKDLLRYSESNKYLFDVLERLEE
ncbi:MAG: metallophosphatase family protein [Candidatus Omnitrophica bacterium]|nr:metallophosphatase family protein [Candidatus Omnitrophota bacterium]